MSAISYDHHNTRKFDELSGKGLKFVHLNITSLLKNIDEVRLFLNDNKVDVFALNETRLDETITENEISVPMFNLLRKDRDRNGGGVAIYIKCGIEYQIVDNTALSQLEALCIKICLQKSKPIFMVNWYRPPNAKLEVIDIYENVLQFLDSQCTNIIVMGDINFDIMNNKYNSACVKYVNVNNLYSLEQINTCEPTRITHRSATLIDHMLTNNINYVKKYGVIHMGMSDHSMSYLFWKGNSSKSEPRHISYRNINGIDIVKFKQDLKNQPWQNVIKCSNLNDAVCKWEELLMYVVNKHMPIKKKRVRQKACPWMNSHIHKLMKERDKLKKKAHIENSELLMIRYRELRNRITGEVRKLKKNYYVGKLTSYEHNASQAWKTLKSLLPNKKAVTSTFHGNDVEVANTFNSFFATIGQTLSETIPYTNDQNNFPVNERFLTENKFELMTVSEDEVLVEIKKLKNKKSTGIDEISSGILKLSAEEITPSLTFLINRSITDKVVPSRWKIAKVIPLFKKGDKNQPNNYRPISLLPIVSKLLERVIHRQLSDYLKLNSILAVEQSGFRPLHSTLTSLVKVTDDWLQAMDKQCYTGAVFVDLRKAFDTVDHNILLNKLMLIGINDSSILWFRDYLANRLIVTQINNTLSDEQRISYGVPQGSILGPLLFVIYVNDIVKTVDTCDIHLYADDTVLYFSDKNPRTVQQSLQSDLDKICAWMCKNRLSLNCDKTVCMLIGNRKLLNKHEILNLNVNSRILDQVHCVKYLGISVDEELNWNTQVNNVCNRVSKMISFLCRLSSIVDRRNMNLIYNSFILPLLDYGDIIWDSGKKFQTDRIQKLQNRASRIILSIDAHSHLSNQNLHQILDWDSLFSRRTKHLLLLVYKALNSLSPSYLSELFKIKETAYSLRSEYNLRTQKPRSNYCKRTVSYRGAINFNQLPLNIKQASSLNIFKRNLKEQILPFM